MTFGIGQVYVDAWKVNDVCYGVQTIDFGTRPHAKTKVINYYKTKEEATTAFKERVNHAYKLSYLREVLGIADYI